MSNQSDEEKRKERIRRAVERYYHPLVCPLCGFEGQKTGIHPFAGRHTKERKDQRWCYGTKEKKHE